VVELSQFSTQPPRDYLNSSVANNKLQITIDSLPVQGTGRESEMSDLCRLGYINGTDFQFWYFTDGIVSGIRKNIGTALTKVERHKDRSFSHPLGDVGFGFNLPSSG